MIETILHAISGTNSGTNVEKEDGQNKGIGSLLVVGIILFVLLGGLKLFQKEEKEAE